MEAAGDLGDDLDAAGSAHLVRRSFGGREAGAGWDRGATRRMERSEGDNDEEAAAPLVALVPPSGSALDEERSGVRAEVERRTVPGVGDQRLKAEWKVAALPVQEVPSCIAPGRL